MFTKSAPFYDAIYAFKDYEDEAERLRAMIQARVPSSEVTLLDVACGTGLHLQYLKKQYAVEGLDLDPNMLEIARRRCPGVPFHQGDLVAFDLGRRFEVVMCLFSSIGYAKTLARMQQAVLTMARHLCPGGLLLVEPWLTPDVFETGRFDARFVDEPDLKIARITTTSREGALSIIDFDYLVGTSDGVVHFTERHEVGLFTHDQYLDAFRAAGLAVDFDPDGFIEKGEFEGGAKTP